MKTFLICLLSILSITFSKSQDYNLVWADYFDGTRLDSTKWNVETNIGIWNTGGNQELEHYKKENVTIGSDGSGNNCLILAAKSESYEGYNFTSGKIDSKGKLSFKYGMIKAKIRMPNVSKGLWPAFWLLGFSTDTWPKCGEIDIAELGAASAITAGKENNRVSGALHWYEGGQADYGFTMDLANKLYDDYHIYIAEWTPTVIKMYIDSVSPTSKYYEMPISGAEKSEFANPYYIIFNLAVGGMFPGIYSAAGITAPMPAKMYVDYVEVYQKSGEGELIEQPAMFGNFGVYDEKGSYNFKLNMGYDAKVTTSNLTSTSITAYEGSECASYATQDGQNFELKFEAISGRNMSNYTTGSFYFYVNTNFTDPLTIGIADKTITIDNASPYNFARTGAWVKVNIPFDAFGTPDLSSVTNFLTINGTGKSGQNIAIDKVYWSPNKASSNMYLGVYTENPNITDKLAFGQGTELYIWEGTLLTISKATAYEGKDVMAYNSAGKGWFGMGICVINGIDLTDYKNGALFLTLKTTSTASFKIGVDGANGSTGSVTIGATSYGMKRDGAWHKLKIPMSSFNASSMDLSSCKNVFTVTGVEIAGLYIDDVYFSGNGQEIANPNIPTALITKSGKKDLEFFPNPASSKITISNAENLTSIQIVDLSGKVIMNISNDKLSESINISSLSKGVYFIKANSEKGMAVQKLIKE